MIDVVLCELEGVIAETRAPRRRALLRAFADEGLELADALADSTLPVRGAVRTALIASGTGHDETLIELLAMRAAQYFAIEAATGLTLAPNVGEVLDGMRSRARLALVTRARRSEVEQILSLALLEDAFEAIVAGDDVIDEKPDPAGYHAVLDRLTRRRTVARPVAIEDGIVGVRAARAAGLPSVVVGELPAHQALEADAMIETLSEHTLESLARLVGARMRVA